MRLEEFIHESLKLKSKETVQLLREMGHVVTEEKVKKYLDRFEVTLEVSRG